MAWDDDAEEIPPLEDDARRQLLGLPGRSAPPSGTAVMDAPPVGGNVPRGTMVPRESHPYPDLAAPDISAAPPVSAPTLPGTMGRPQRSDIAYLAPPVTMGRRALGVLQGALAGAGNPGSGAAAGRAFINAPAVQANQRYERDLADYEGNRKEGLENENEERLNDTAQSSNAERSAAATKDTAEAGQYDMTPVELGDGTTVQVPKKDAERLQATLAANKSRADIAAKGNQSREGIAAGANKTREDIAAEQAAAAERRVNLQDATRKQIAAEHEATAAGKAANPATLTAANKGRAEFANTVLEQLPPIYKEIDDIASEIGPGEGRWNNFWVNKGGVNDPKYAGLDQDLGLLASAVAVMHFGARGGGQAFIQSLKKDFGEAQSPEDLKARIESAGKWAHGYANQQPMAPTGGNAPPTAPSANTGGITFTPLPAKGR